MQTLAFRTLYVLVFVHHARRELVHLNVTTSPTAAWIWRQFIAATPWGSAPRYLVRDRDAAYGRDFGERRRSCGRLGHAGHLLGSAGFSTRTVTKGGAPPPLIVNA